MIMLKGLNPPFLGDIIQFSIGSEILRHEHGIKGQLEKIHNETLEKSTNKEKAIKHRSNGMQNAKL